MSQPVVESGTFKNVTGTGAISAGPGVLIGFYVNSTTGGTIIPKDGDASSGTAMSGAITPAIGFHRFPAVFGQALYVTIANTLNVTLFFTSQGA